ncbi:MAG TPA: chemotaxis protein CheW [Rhodocyclaceae bacterium]|jgi:twitching motility protein PilI
MNSKTTLKEFQQGLNDKLTKAGRGASPGALLCVESGGERWVLDLSDAGEVVPLPTLADVPLTQAWYAGLVNMRGNLFSVVDLAVFHGFSPTPHNGQARLLLVGPRHGINSALLVNRILGLRAPEGLKAEPVIADPKRPWAGEKLRDAQGEVWRRLVVPTLLASPRFLDIAL